MRSPEDDALLRVARRLFDFDCSPLSLDEFFGKNKTERPAILGGEGDSEYGSVVSPASTPSSYGSAEEEHQQSDIKEVVFLSDLRSVRNRCCTAFSSLVFVEKIPKKPSSPNKVCVLLVFGGTEILAFCWGVGVQILLGNTKNVTSKKFGYRHAR